MLISFASDVNLQDDAVPVGEKKPRALAIGRGKRLANLKEAKLIAEVRDTFTL
jgi:hypothetical protein